MFVIAVEEGVLLAPMGFHVGGVDIEGDAHGRRLVGVGKQGDEQVGEFLDVAVESCDQGGARAAWALKNRSL